MRHIFYIAIFWIQFSFEFIHLQSRTRYNIFLHRKKSYQLLICRVAKNLPVLELVNHFIKLGTVAYKQVACKKNLVYLSLELSISFINCAQDCVSLISKQKAVKKKMRICVNIKVTRAKWIQSIFKTMFEFMPTQVA